MLQQFRRKESLFEFIQRHINPDGPGLLQSGDTLPDEDQIVKTRGLRMVPGLSDRFSGPSGEPSLRLEKLVQSLVAASRWSGIGARQRLEKVISDDDCIQWIDELGQRISQNPAIRLDKIRPLLRSIALRTQHRGALKYAIALLGFCGNQADLPIYEVVGRHEEFTKYVAVAFANTLDDPMECWFRLAQHVEGWGKIELVTRMCERGPLSPEIRWWLLRYGCENSIMNEYLGLEVAQAVDLVEALRHPNPDDALIRGAGIILQAMTDEGPAAGFSEYPQGSEAVRLFLTHLSQRPGSLESLVDVGSLAAYLTSPECNWDDRAELAELAAHVIEQPHWPPLVFDALSGSDRAHVWMALRAARFLQLDITEIIRVQLRKTPSEPALWQDLMRRTNRATLASALDLAAELLPIDEMCTGPEVGSLPSLGTGPYLCFSFVLEGLKDYPGQGSTLLARALRSRSEQHRVIVLSVLGVWPDKSVISSLRGDVEDCRQSDPSERIRRRAAEVLQEWDLQCE